jgi:hypothetical protein
MAAVLAAGPGCVSYCHLVPPPPAELAFPCQSVPAGVRDHVYVFLIHGLDPVNFANLSGLRDYIQRLGFNKTYYGQLYHRWYFKNELLRIRESDPKSHFVLIGFSFGANMVRDMALAAQENGIDIDLLVYLGGNTLDNTPHDRPPNAHMVVNILASGCIWNGTTLDDAENFHLPDVWHFGSPTHRVTLEVLAKDLAVVAHSLPQPAVPALPNTDEEAPTPRPVTLHVSVRHDQWDFLKPAASIAYQPGPAAPPAQGPTQHVSARFPDGQ